MSKKNINHELISIDNHRVKFKLDGETYLVLRKDACDMFNLYWFMGDVYNKFIILVDKEREWLKKYRQA